MAKTYKSYKPRKYGKKKYTVKVSKPVKAYVAKALKTTSKLEKKLFTMSGSGTLNNNVATGQYAAIFDMGLIPRYDPASTTVQEGSLGQARTKEAIVFNKCAFSLWLKNSSALNQFVRLVIVRQSNMYEQYEADGANMYMDQTGTQVPFSTALLQGQRLQVNYDLVSSHGDILCDKTIPLPYDSSYEGGSIPISYIRKMIFKKVLNEKISYERASDDVSAISPKGGRYIIFFHQIHGQTATANNCTINFEWRLDQFFSE